MHQKPVLINHINRAIGLSSTAHDWDIYDSINAVINIKEAVAADL